MTDTKYPFIKLQWIFSILRIFFSLTFIGLDYELSRYSCKSN